MEKSKEIFIQDRNVRVEIPVHLSEDYELESNKVLYLKRLWEDIEYEWYWSVCQGLAS